MSYCPYCGEVRNDDATFCSHCGKRFEEEFIPERSGLIEHLKYAMNLCLRNPVIFVPEFIGSLLLAGIFYVIGEILATSDFMSYLEHILGDSISNVKYVQYDYPDIPPEAFGPILTIAAAVIVGAFVISGVSGLFTYANVKMVRDSYGGGSPDMRGSFSYVGGRLGRLFLGSVIANVLVFTLILIPAAFYMYAIMVVDEAGIRESLSKGFKLFMDNILASIAIIVLYYVCRWAVEFIPWVSDQVFVIPSTIIIAAMVDMYVNQRGKALEG